MSYYYFVEEYGEDDVFPINPTWAKVDTHLAEECAEDYHYNHDGWEASWPLTICIRTEENGPVVGRFEVDRETVPSFVATQKAQP